MAINIQVNENFRIKSDERSIIVEKRFVVDPTKAPNWAKRKAEGASPELRDEWREVTYHGSVERALQSIVEQAVRDSDATSLSDLIREIRRLKRDISGLVSDLG